MSIVLVGGMDRLGDKYQKEARDQGMDLHIFSQADQNMGNRIKHADVVVIFTNMVSHQARHDAYTAAKKKGIPVIMHHSCGVCTFRECLNCLSLMNQPADTPHTIPAKSGRN